MANTINCELNCAGGSLCSVTTHGCCFLTCIRGVSCTHSAWSYQAVSQAWSSATEPNPLAAVHLPCAPLASKACHSGTLVVGSSSYWADSESRCISHLKPPHPTWHLCSASGLPVKPAHCHHHGGQCFPAKTQWAATAHDTCTSSKKKPSWVEVQFKLKNE